MDDVRWNNANMALPWALHYDQQQKKKMWKWKNN
jgi:hypothetical protein